MIRYKPAVGIFNKMGLCLFINNNIALYIRQRNNLNLMHKIILMWTILLYYDLSFHSGEDNVGMSFLLTFIPLVFGQNECSVEASKS